MRTIFWSVVCAGLMAIGQIAHAEEIPIVTAPVRIPIGQTHTFDFGTVPQRNTTVLLKISSRLDSDGLGGSMFFMRIRLNGRDVQAAKSRTAMRLVNKPVTSPVAPNIPSTWYGGDIAGWRALYAPDFKAALAQKFYTGNPYELVLDVTDLTNPISDNRLEITNTASANTKIYSHTNADLVIGEMTIETKPVPSGMMSETGDLLPVINRGEPAAGAASYQGKVLSGGGFSMSTGKSTFTFNSSFSYPNAGFNHFSASSQTDNQPGWKINVNPKANRVFAQGVDYRIERSIKWEKTHAEIVDTITNLHKDAPLGLAVRNEMDLSGLKDPEIRIAGNPDPAVNEYYAPGNPSVYVRLPKSGIGMIAEDDVLRNQAVLYTKPAEANAPAVVGIRSDMLRLAPGETYSLRWAVYPVAGPDYFDFVNLVRDDWKANFPVLGGWWWGFNPDAVLQMPLPKLRDLLVKNGIHYATIGGGWVDRMHDPKHIGFGTGVFDSYWDDYRRRVREAGDKLREAVPGFKVMAYYDAQRDTSENSSAKFPDSWRTDANGKQMYTDWNGAYSRSFSMVPTLQNSFGKAMLNVAQRYFTDMKLNGIYWDEMENTGYGAPELTYNIFDGHSAQLDPKTWTIQREVGITSLTSLPFRMAVIAEAQKHGGVMLGNGPATSQQILHTDVQRMIEIQHNDSYGYQGNLETPLGYISGYIDWKSFLRAFNQAMLPVSGFSANGFPHDITPYLFPFTPIEIHPGYLLGQERIIVTHNGNYGWHNEKVLSFTHHFDQNGKLTATHFPIHITANGARTAVTLKDNEAAVLEKIPVSFSPDTKVLSSKVLLPKWKATVTVINIDNNRVTLEIDAPQGGILSAKNGKPILIKPGFNGGFALDYAPSVIPINGENGIKTFFGGETGPIF